MEEADLEAKPLNPQDMEEGGNDEADCKGRLSTNRNFLSVRRGVSGLSVDKSPLMTGMFFNASPNKEKFYQMTQ